MKKLKPLAIVLCAVLLVAGSILGTVAYLTDASEVVNTFTVGDVDLTLDEAVVTPDGKPAVPADRTENGNQYHLVPSVTYTKDPTVTVKKGSEESYVRMIVTINCAQALDDIFAPGVSLTKIFNDYDPNWRYVAETRDAAADTVSYEFRYKSTVKATDADLQLEPLFKSFTVPAEITGAQLKEIASLEIRVEAHAIQATGFSNDDAAWTAFSK